MTNKGSPTLNADGTLTHDGIKACQLMKIDPEALKVVTAQDLINEGVEAHLAAVRVEHLAEKRLKRIEMLDNTIKSGMLT